MWVVIDGKTVLHLVVAEAAIVEAVVEVAAVIVAEFAGVVVGCLKMTANEEFGQVVESEEDVQLPESKLEREGQTQSELP